LKNPSVTSADGEEPIGRIEVPSCSKRVFLDTRGAGVVN